MGCRTQRPHVGTMMLQLGPSIPSFDRALSLLDPLLRRAALGIEGYDPLGRASQIGDDEADAAKPLGIEPSYGECGIKPLVGQETIGE
jgi:hypothetical protein